VRILVVDDEPTGRRRLEDILDAEVSSPGATD
jgi:hypothetical protein